MVDIMIHKSVLFRAIAIVIIGVVAFSLQVGKELFIYHKDFADALASGRYVIIVGFVLFIAYFVWSAFRQGKK